MNLYRRVAVSPADPAGSSATVGMADHPLVCQAESASTTQVNDVFACRPDGCADSRPCPAHANSGGTPGYSGGVPPKAGQIFWNEHQPHSFEVFGAKFPVRALSPIASQVRARSFST